MTEQRQVPFCTCGHSLYDHAVETAVDPLNHDFHGECFVGGCGCGRWHRDV
jgi:hypothetical protein